MRLGLIARADTTGLAVQCHEFWRHMQPAKTLVIAATWNPHMPCDESMYPGATIHRECKCTDTPRPDPVMDAFLDDLDIVFTAETFYNTWLVKRANERKVKTVQQYNFEFLDTTRAAPQPTLYAAPSMWRFHDVPFHNKAFLPVPVARDRLPFRQRTGLKTLLHVAGIPAVHDRNGSQLVMEAMRHLPDDVDVKLRVRTQEVIPGKLRDPRIEIVTDRIDRYWKLYGDEDVFVMPRKFGGLCLPLAEAASCGMPTLMSAVDPQIRFLPGRALIPSRVMREFQVRSRIVLHETNAEDIARRITELYRNPDEVAALSRAVDRYADSISWDRLKPFYVSTFERVCNGEEVWVQ